MTAGTAASRVELAAEALETFLRNRRIGRPFGAVPHSPAVRQGMRPPADFAERTHSAGQTRSTLPGSTATTSHGTHQPQRLPHTDWLLHRLAVTGSAASLAAFREAASGAGTIPWRLDLDSLEEDWLHRLMHPAQRTLSLAGARVLAGQLRDAVEHRHAVAVARVGYSHACALDLHALVPVPAAILDLGPDHPDALAWLWQHWGTMEALRHVAAETTPVKLAALPLPAAGEDRLRLSFRSADWTPWRALARIRADWPMLRFDVQPQYDRG